MYSINDFGTPFNEGYQEPIEGDRNHPQRRGITKIFLIMFLISTFGAICVSKFRFIVSKKIIDIWKGI